MSTSAACVGARPAQRPARAGAPSGLRGIIHCTAFAMLGCVGCPTPLAPQLSGSVGAPHSGVLTNAKELPMSGSGYVRFRPHGSYYWGNPGLVQMLETVSASVARESPGGPPLVVGDLSAQEGGKIPRHRSHRTGRDVDLLWFVKTLDGAPIRNPGFVRVDSDGLAPMPTSDEYVRLDVEREWSLFRALLTSPSSSVQWLFVSREVEALLIDYARARGDDPELVWRAETTMLQPGDSASHDDHVHVRVACSGDDAVHGCTGGGPHWEWLTPLPELGPLVPTWFEQVARDDPFVFAGLPTPPATPDPDA